MFEARCPSCSATYQVDERRVPPQGLKMRCPKCGESFQVTAPQAPPESVPPVLGAALGLGAVPPAKPKPPARKPTMIGVAEQGGSSSHRPAPPIAREDKKPTMMGLAPGAANLGLELAQLDDDSDGGGEVEELDLTEPISFREDAGLPVPTSRPSPSAGIIDLPSIGPGEDGDGDASSPDSAELDLSGPAELPELPDLPDLPSARAPAAGLPAMGGRGAPPPRKAPPQQKTSPQPKVAKFRPENLPDLPDLGVGLPGLNSDLPDLGSDLPDLGGNLPQPARADLPDLGGTGLPHIDPTSQHPGALPDLPGLEEGARPRGFVDSGAPFSAPSDFPGSVDSGEIDPFAAPTGVAQPSRPAAPASFGEVDFGGPRSNEEEEFDAFPTEEQQAGGAGQAAGYGDVTLEGGEGDLDLGDSLDRGSIPAGLPRGPAAAASAAVDLSAPARPEKYADKKVKARKKRTKTTAMSKGTRIALISVLALAVAGGALASLLPDVGPYGAYFVIDQIKGDEYQSHLALDASNAQKRMAMDTSEEIVAAFQEVKSGLASAPRYRPRLAYAAYIGFFHQLRFGAASDESAQAQALMDSLAEVPPETQYLELAQLTQKAAGGHPEVPTDQAARLLPRGVEYAQLVGESALAKQSGEIAAQAFSQLLKTEQSARAHFGMARALQLLGKSEEAREQNEKALAANPRHAGARILAAALKLKGRHDDESILATLTPLGQGQDGASRGEQVQALTLIGELYLQRGRLKKAEESFNQALGKNAGSAEAQRGLAQVLFKSGRYSEALARYESALSVEPGDLKTALGIVQCKLRLEQLQDAVKMLDDLAPQHPNSTALAYWMGSAKETAGDKDVARSSYEKAIKLGQDVPELVSAYIALTRLLGQAGQHLEAQKVIDEAEKNFPNDPAVFEALGELAANRGSFDDAVANYDKAIALDPEDVGLHFARAVALRQARRFEDAAREFDLVESESKDYPGLALERGNLFEAAGKSEEALEAYEQALAAAPEDLDLKLRVACGKANAGQTEAATKLLAPVLEARPNSAEVNFCQGIALLNSGTDLPRARLFLERAVSRDPSRAKHHLYVGWVDLEMGDLAAASRALDEAIKLDSTLPDAYWKRGELLVKQRAVRDALSDLDRALELAPSRTEAHAQKALAYLELGQEQQAMAEFEIATSAPVVDAAWNYRYGDLLLANRRPAEAKKQLQIAVEKGEQRAVKPIWLPNAHRLLALSIGRKREALEHWQAYVSAKKGTNDPYLGEAAREMDSILSSLGH